MTDAEAASRRRSLPLAPAQTRPETRDATAAVGASGASITINNLGRQFETPDGPVVAIHDIDLTIQPGEFCVIVGPSGCGKTTLLRIIAGLERATSGRLEQTRPDGGRPSNAMVFQGRSVFPWMTVRHNVAYGLKLHGVGRRQRLARAEQLLDLVGLHGFANSYPHQLSEGMRQRVAIARALAVDPDILLMDEPFGALDEQTRFLLQEELLRIWENTGKTVVFVTHSIDEAINLADRIVVMSAHPGTIKQILPVPLARPRALATLRSDPVAATLFGDIWAILREEVTAARAAAGVRP